MPSAADKISWGRLLMKARTLPTAAKNDFKLGGWFKLNRRWPFQDDGFSPNFTLCGSLRVAFASSCYAKLQSDV